MKKIILLLYQFQQLKLFKKNQIFNLNNKFINLKEIDELNDKISGANLPFSNINNNIFTKNKSTKYRR